ALALRFSTQIAFWACGRRAEEISSGFCGFRRRSCNAAARWNRGGALRRQRFDEHRLDGTWHSAAQVAEIRRVFDRSGDRRATRSLGSAVRETSDSPESAEVGILVESRIS